MFQPSHHHCNNKLSPSVSVSWNWTYPFLRDVNSERQCNILNLCPLKVKLCPFGCDITNIGILHLLNIGVTTMVLP